MKSAQDIANETSEILGNAVAAVTLQALKPELNPFRIALHEATRKLDDAADGVSDAITPLLEKVDGLGATVAAGAADRRSAQAQTAEGITRLQTMIEQAQQQQERDLAALTAVVRQSQQQRARFERALRRLLILNVALTPAVGAAVIAVLVTRG